MTLDKHDYIGKSDASSMENCEKKCVLVGENEGKSKGLNLKATELRLGLPGSESPERENGAEVESKNGYPVWVVKGLVSGAKRGFSDTANNGGCGQWLFTGSGGSEVDLGKGDVLFSPKGVHAPVKAIGGAESGIPQSFMAGKELRVASTVGKEPVVQSCSKQVEEKNPQVSALKSHGIAPASKAQVVGWPPVRSFRKNSMAINPPKSDEDANTKMGNGCLYIKVSMDGAPYLRKVDLKTYKSYKDLSSALEKMFSCFTIGQCGSHGVHIQDGISESGLVDLLHGSEYVLTYEDKDSDWMLVGDVPWDLFTDSCKRLRIMKSSDAVGLAPRATEKCRNRNN